MNSKLNRSAPRNERHKRANDFTPEQQRMIARAREFARQRVDGVSPNMQKAALAAVLGGTGIAAAGALIDQFVGEDNALNSGEFFINSPIASLPIVGAGLGAVAGTRLVGPERREQVTNEEIARAKEGLKELAREDGYLVAQQKFADQKNAAINRGIHLRNQRAFGGAALGAVLGTAGSLALLRDGSTQPAQPGVSQSIAASLSEADRNDIITLLKDNGVI